MNDSRMFVRVTYNVKRLGDVAVFERRQPVTEAKFVNRSSLFILLLGVIRRLELKPISEQKAENIFVAPPYCQTDVSGSLFGRIHKPFFNLFLCTLFHSVHIHCPIPVLPSHSIII